MRLERAPAIVGTTAIVVTLVGMLLWSSMLAGPWRLVSGLLDTRSLLARGQKDLANGAIKPARYEIVAAAAAARRAANGLGSGSPLFDLARISSRLDDALGEVGHLVRAAGHSARAASGTLEVAQGALRGPDKIILRDLETGEGEIRIERVEATGAVISEVRQEVGALQRELRAVDLAKLPGRVRPRINDGLKKAEETDAVLADAEAGFRILPELLGKNGPKTYLLAMQNNAELRGTGGSILQFALLQIDQGRPKLLPARTVYEIDRARRQLALSLPADAWYLRGIEDARRFGNANWSPDWPLSARLTLDYAEASDVRLPEVALPQIDGVILVDPIVMKNLLKGAGAIRRETGRRITAGRVVFFLLYEAYAEFPIVQHRRSVLREVVDGFYERMLKPAHPLALVEGMGRSLATKHMQIWLRDRPAQRFVERMDWDGALEKARHADYLFIVQQNVGGNKLNFYEEVTTEIDVDIDGDDARHSTSVRLFNGVLVPQPRYALGDSGPWHRPMVNLYVPASARLRRVEAPPVGAPRGKGVIRLDQAVAPAAWAGDSPAEHFELGKRVWSATLEIPARQQGTLRFDYVVPDVVRTEDGRSVYRIVVQHQPRVRPERLVLRVSLPAAATAIRAPGWEREANDLVFDETLERDLELEVSWQS